MKQQTFKFECPECGQRVSTTLDIAGTKANCPSCKTLIVVPKPPRENAAKERPSINPDHYLLLTNSEQRGPYALSQLQNMWCSGSITADTLYWQKGLTEWTPISILAVLLDPPKPQALLPNMYHPPSPARRHSSAQPLKSPGVAAVLSFLIPGLGQIYNGQIGSGVFLWLLTTALYLTTILGFILLGLVLHIFITYNAHTTARKINARMRGRNAC